MKLAAFLTGLLLVSAQARPIGWVPPEKLDAAAEVIVNGVVEGVALTEERSAVHLGPHAVQTRGVEALISVLKVIKGEPPSEFALRFPTVDVEREKMIINGPLLGVIEKGKRYRFYLKKKGSAYVGVLDGEFDSGFFAQRLLEKEPDDSPPLFREEAVAIACKQFKSLRPKPTFRTIEGFSDGSTWKVSFYCGAPLEYPAFTSDAEIQVDGARQITRESWVGKERPRKGDQLSSRDVGTLVRLTVEGEIRDDVFHDQANVITALFGKIRRIEGDSIHGTFASPSFQGEGEKRVLVIPRKALGSVQQIFPVGEGHWSGL
jgi:hypothetical protein